MTNIRADIVLLEGISYVGKSTIAEELAKILNYTYINTGHMYRGIAWLAKSNNIGYDSDDKIIELAKHTEFKFKRCSDSNSTRTFINDLDLTEKLDEIDTVHCASKIAKIGEVREVLIEKQKKLISLGSLVVEGRNLSTEVFPGASTEVFITANIEVRAKRMKKVLTESNLIDNIDFSEFIKKIEDLDKRDFTRKISPVKMGKNAISYDNSLSPSAKNDAIFIYYHMQNPSKVSNQKFIYTSQEFQKIELNVKNIKETES